MALKRLQATEVKDTSNGDKKLVFTNLEEGDNEGRLVYVADLGLQAKEFKGEFKGNFQQLSLGIEIVGKSVTTEDGEVLPRILWTRPFYIYSSMGTKSKEFEYYSIFEPKAKEDSVPDWESQLNKPVNVYVTHSAGKDGAIYDNIEKLSPIPSKYQEGVEAAITEPAIGDSTDPNNKCTKALFGLAKFVFDKRITNEAPAQKKAEPPKFDDDVPF